MECKSEHFRHILLFYFRKGKNAAQAAKTLRDAYGEEALKDSVEIGLINSVLGIFHSKMSNVIFQHDDATPHTSLATR